MLLRNRRAILGFALTGLAAAMLTVPATAFAGHGDRRDRSEHRDDGERHRGDRRDRAEHRDRARHAESGWSQRRHARRHHASYRHANHVARGHGRMHKARRHYPGPAYSYRHASTNRHDASYYCEPCNHRFRSRSGFHSHLSGSHHIAPWRLPFVIVHHTLGWIFFG